MHYAMHISEQIAAICIFLVAFMIHFSFKITIVLASIGTIYAGIIDHHQHGYHIVTKHGHHHDGGYGGGNEGGYGGGEASVGSGFGGDFGGIYGGGDNGHHDYYVG